MLIISCNGTLCILNTWLIVKMYIKQIRILFFWEQISNRILVLYLLTPVSDFQFICIIWCISNYLKVQIICHFSCISAFLLHKKLSPVCLWIIRFFIKNLKEKLIGFFPVLIWNCRKSLIKQLIDIHRFDNFYFFKFNLFRWFSLFWFWCWLVNWFRLHHICNLSHYIIKCIIISKLAHLQTCKFFRNIIFINIFITWNKTFVLILFCYLKISVPFILNPDIVIIIIWCTKCKHNICWIKSWIYVWFTVWLLFSFKCGFW